MKTKTNTEAGGVLVLVMVLVLLMGGLGAGLMQLGTGTGLEVSYAVNDANAFWAAEAGMERAKTIGQMKRKRYSVIPKPVGTGTLLGTNVLSGVTSKGSYSVSIVDDTSGGWDNSVHTLQKYVITSVGQAQGGSTHTVVVRAWLLNYAGYMHASHSENGVNFATGDTLDGPVYTDDQLHIIGPAGPIFKQLVSSGASTVDYNGWNPTAAQFNAVWQGGLALNAAPLDIQGQFGDHITDIQTESQLGGLDLEGGAAGDYNFTFFNTNSIGKFVYQKRPSGAKMTNTLSSLNGTIYVDGNVYVQGVVNGQVTLASRHAINIVSNIVYESASGANPDPWNASFNVANVNDMLGLMAVDSVNIQGVNSIDIHASIMITSGGLNADNYTMNIGGKYINLFGGVSQFTRGAVGQPTSPFHGFHKNYKFDQRYASEAPPSFPPSLYMFTSWQ